MPLPRPFPYRQPPFEKQREALKASALERAYALFMEQGTGKTFVAINSAAAQWYMGWINALVILAPKGVHSNWVTDEIPKWMPEDIPYTVIHWRTGAMTSKHQREKTRAAIADTSKLCILAINIDAISHRTGKTLVDHVLRKRPSMMVIDESSDIANHTADRSRAAHRLGRLAFSRRILNGTPGNALKLYSQFLFLDWRFLGDLKWKDYQLRWAEWHTMDSGNTYSDGRPKLFLIQKRNPEGKPIFKNQEELQRRMYAHAFRCTKDDCFDLPPKLYNKIYPVMNAEQHRMYRELVEEFETTFNDGAEVSVRIKLTLYLRLQQILCGYVPVDKHLEIGEIDSHIAEPERLIDGPNHRLEALMDYVEHSGDTQGIIWCRFKRDIQLITAAMRKHGKTFVEYHGSTSDDMRTLSKTKFQNGNAQWFIGNPVAGGRGLTLTAAKLMAYYSNVFGLEYRQQSEDRAHRYGTTSLTITDFVVPGTVDEIILRALRNNREVADELTGDIPKPWI